MIPITLKACLPCEGRASGRYAETAEQWEILRRQGWDEGQGWLFGYPAAVL